MVNIISQIYILLVHSLINLKQINYLKRKYFNKSYKELLYPTWSNSIYLTVQKVNNMTMEIQIMESMKHKNVRNVNSNKDFYL